MQLFFRLVQKREKDWNRWLTGLWKKEKSYKQILPWFFRGKCYNYSCVCFGRCKRRSCIEVVITGRTRNALALRGTWVRIPPTPPFFFKFLFHFIYLFFSKFLQKINFQIETFYYNCSFLFTFLLSKILFFKFVIFFNNINWIFSNKLYIIITIKLII